MRASRNRGAVKAVSPDTSLIEEDEEVVATPLKGKKNEKKSSVVKDENDSKFTVDDKPMQLKTAVASPKRPLKTVVTVTPSKDEENQPLKSSKKGAFGRLILIDEDGCTTGKAVRKASRLVNVVYRYLGDFSRIDESLIPGRCH